MSADTASESRTIPTPAAAAKAQLLRAPRWLRRFVVNALAVIAWIGLPSTVLSTLSSMQFVLDGAMWLYRHAGALRPALLATGEGISMAVGVWRDLTHPIWQTLLEWLQLSLPPWAPDLFTLVVVIGLGALRRHMRARGGLTHSQLHLFYSLHWFHPEWGSEEYDELPEEFPFADAFVKSGINLTRARRLVTQRIWSTWRTKSVGSTLKLRRSSRVQRYNKALVREQFIHYWRAVMDGRRDMRIYTIGAALIAFALAVDWAYRAGSLQ